MTNRKVGIADDEDHTNWVERGSRPNEMIEVARGPDYCGLAPTFTHQTRRVGELGRTYNAVARDRTDNSNSTVYTILDEMDLPKRKPPIIAPGWGTNLHRTKRVHEVIGETLDGIDRQIDWFDGLDPADQIRALQRAFGG